MKIYLGDLVYDTVKTNYVVPLNIAYIAASAQEKFSREVSLCHHYLKNDDKNDMSLNNITLLLEMGGLKAIRNKIRLRNKYSGDLV